MNGAPITNDLFIEKPLARVGVAIRDLIQSLSILASLATVNVAY